MTAGNNGLVCGGNIVFAVVFFRVAVPYHSNADPDPSLHLNADPDATFLFNADPDPDPAPQ